MNTDYVIWDIDNCLADDAHRIQLIDHSLKGDDRWAAYHSLAHLDKCPDSARQLFEEWHVLGVTRARNGLLAKPVFFTGRPAYHHIVSITDQWLRLHLGVVTPALHMRSPGDLRGAVEVKREMLLRFRATLHPSDRIVAAYDDRTDIVEMYRSEVGGVEGARVVRIHEDMSPHPELQPKVPGTIEPGCPEDWADVDSLARLRPFTIDEISRSMHFDGMRRAAAAAQKGLGQAATPRAPLPSDLLRQAAKTFEERNATYGDAYKRFGALAAALFPDGLQLKGEAEFGRFAVLLWSLSKLQRYAAQFATGGHADSARDLAVYAAMLQELTDECPF
jgi:hypothetical protein